MSPEQLVAIISAVTALVVALVPLFVQIHMLRKDVNGRLTQLVDAASIAAEKRGELSGRDFMHRLLTGTGAPAEGSTGAPVEPLAKRGDGT